MAKIVTVEQMVAIEKKADASGLQYDQMMENAGKAVADRILQVWPQAASWRILVLVGPGNNGGDGLVAGNHLTAAGADVVYYLIKDRPDDDTNLVRVREHMSLITVVAQDKDFRVLDTWLDSSDLILDGLLGTGFRLPLGGAAQMLLTRIGEVVAQREKRLLVAAIDCPSGLDCDSGEVAPECIPADITITLAAAKPGLLIGSGAQYSGKIYIGTIGLDQHNNALEEIRMEMMEPVLAQTWLPDRPKDSHKGTFGRVLIVAGSINYPGAAVLAAKGAYRCGSGLVTLAVPEPIYLPLVSMLAEATWIILPHNQGAISASAVDVLRQHLDNTQALLIGPGLGQERQTEQFMRKLFASDETENRIGFMDAGHPQQRIPLPPLVLDADALKLLAKIESWETLIPEESILTPHPGEMSVLTGLTVEMIQIERMKTAQEWSKKWGQVVVLKGANTVIASPGGRTMIVPIATAALACAGTGDVLAGVIASLRGQGLEAFEAAALGAYLHARAGELAAEIYQTTASVMAGDIAETLPEVLAELKPYTPV